MGRDSNTIYSLPFTGRIHLCFKKEKKLSIGVVNALLGTRRLIVFSTTKRNYNDFEMRKNELSIVDVETKLNGSNFLL